MGAPKGEPRIRINTNATGKGKRRREVACLTETFALLTCYKGAGFNEQKCANARKALDACLDMRAKAPKKLNTINHHLNRLVRLTKK
jgi:hypothetical protein